MENNINSGNAKLPTDGKGNNNKIIGIVIVIIGIVLLIRATDIIHYSPFLKNLFSFPLLLIVLGLAIGSRDKFNVGGWVFLVGFGAFFFIRDLGFNLNRFAFPIILIGLGLYVLLKNKQKSNYLNQSNNEPYPPNITQETQNINNTDYTQQQYNPGQQYQHDNSQAEYVKIDTVFSGNDRIILSPDFRGGRLGTIFGSVVLDCKSANIQQDIVIDLYTVFGGIELIFPANWRVINEITSVFGSVEDKRRLVNNTGTERRVILTGFVLFGGVEIKNL